MLSTFSSIVVWRTHLPLNLDMRQGIFSLSAIGQAARFFESSTHTIHNEFPRFEVNYWHPASDFSKQFSSFHFEWSILSPPLVASTLLPLRKVFISSTDYLVLALYVSFPPFSARLQLTTETIARDGFSFCFMLLLHGSLSWRATKNSQTSWAKGAQGRHKGAT